MSFSASAHHEHEHTVAGASDNEAGSRVALRFGTQDRATDAIKTYGACLMQAIIAERDRCAHDLARVPEEGNIPHQLALAKANQGRGFSHALTLIEDGVKAAVGALHAPKNAGVRGA